MRDINLEEECDKKELDYEELWNREEEERAKKEIKGLSKGSPRKGIEGRYIKRRGAVTRRQIGMSYARYFKELRDS